MNQHIPKTVHEYLRKIAREGGKKSRRQITPEQQKKMQEGRRKRNEKDRLNRK